MPIQNSYLNREYEINYLLFYKKRFYIIYFIGSEQSFDPAENRKTVIKGEIQNSYNENRRNNHR